MQCHECNRNILNEGDVHDYILCRYCDRSATKQRPTNVHCFTCGCKRVWHDRFSKVKSILKSTLGSSRFLTLGGISLMLLLALGLFKPLLAISIASGIAALVAAIPLVVVAVFALYVFGRHGLGLFTCIHDFGRWLYKGSFIDDISDDDLSGFLRWLFGLVTLLSPVVLYWLGRLAHWILT